MSNWPADFDISLAYMPSTSTTTLSTEEGGPVSSVMAKYSSGEWAAKLIAKSGSEEFQYPEGNVCDSYLLALFLYKLFVVQEPVFTFNFLVVLTGKTKILKRQFLHTHRLRVQHARQSGPSRPQRSIASGAMGGRAGLPPQVALSLRSLCASPGPCFGGHGGDGLVAR